MKANVLNNPKDEHITNKDDSVTNKDGDNYLEKGKQPTDEDNSDKEGVPVVTSKTENASPAKAKDSDEERERLKHTL
jgi:hypothetical protein